MVIRVFGEARRGHLRQPSFFDPLMEFLRAVGDELRRARQEAGLALRDLNPRSAREFKASAVGGYERGERSISLDRFCRLAGLYGLAPDQLLARVLERATPEVDADDVVIDLRRAQQDTAPELDGRAKTEAEPQAATEPSKL